MRHLGLLSGSIIVAFVVTFFAVMMGGAGHGWISGMLSATSLLTGPAGVAAWMTSSSRRRRIIAITVLAINIIVDVLLLVCTVREGTDVVVETYSHTGVFMLVWAALWLGLQWIPAAALVRRDHLILPSSTCVFLW